MIDFIATRRNAHRPLRSDTSNHRAGREKGDRATEGEREREKEREKEKERERERGREGVRERVSE